MSKDIPTARVSGLEGAWFNNGEDAWFHYYQPEDTQTICGIPLQFKMKVLKAHTYKKLIDDCKECHTAFERLSILEELGE